MAHSTDIPYIDRGNIDYLILELSNSLFRKYSNSLVDFNILIVGGSALALKHGFRSTVDIDADLRFRNEITSCIYDVSARNNIPNDWINQDFMKSTSYSIRLWDNAIFYKKIGYINVFVVNDLDQLCMKVVSGRPKDIKDIQFLCDRVMSQGIRYSDFLYEYSYLYGTYVTPNTRARSRVQKIFKRNRMY